MFSSIWCIQYLFHYFIFLTKLVRFTFVHKGLPGKYLQIPQGQKYLQPKQTRKSLWHTTFLAKLQFSTLSLIIETKGSHEHHGLCLSFWFSLCCVRHLQSLLQKPNSQYLKPFDTWSPPFRRCPNNNSYTSELLLPLLSHSTSTETLQVDPTAMEHGDHHPPPICQSSSTCTPSNSSSSPKFAAPSEGFSSLSHLDQEEEERDGGGMSSWFENENLPELHSKGTNLNLTDELSSGTDSEESTNDELPSYEMNVLSYGEGNLDSWTIDIVIIIHMRDAIASRLMMRFAHKGLFVFVFGTLSRA